jgi:hypothetical protein
MTREEAILLINGYLSIDAAITVRGDEVKCWVADQDEGGRYKTYFDRRNCLDLARAFHVLADTFAAAPQAGEDT